MTETPENQNSTPTQQTEEPTIETTETTNHQENTPQQDPAPTLEQTPFEPTENHPPPLPTQHVYQQKPKNTKIIMVSLLAICLLAGSFIGYAVTYSTLNNKIDNLQTQLQTYILNTQNNNDTTTNTTTINTNEINIQPSPEPSNPNNSDSLSQLYQNVKASVIVVQGLVQNYNWWGYPTGYSTQQGSGFVTSVNGQQVIVTNNHVIHSATNLTVTFADGKSYPATVLGADEYADLAILKVDSIPTGTPSLTFARSSNLNIGDTVVAVGSPYELTGTLTTGIISALGRTIIEQIGNREITIPDTIQTSTQINPGNSGGPLINMQGQVVGITTAAISGSQGLGFAIPSDTIMREIASLVNTGKYTQHPSLNAVGRDMTLQIAQAMNVDITYGWLVESVSESSALKGGTSQTTILGSRVIIGGDIIIGVGNTTITSTDELLSYLERNTTPNQKVNFTIIRDGQQQTITVEIGALN
jgi:S1-C subfamily serine protease